MEEAWYRLQPGEGVAEGLRRTVAARVADVIRHVERPGPDRGEDLHEVRTIAKRLRAMWRLVRAFAGEAVYRRENERIRDAARRLSGPRDLAVAAETLRAVLAGEALSESEGREFEEALASVAVALPPAQEIESALHAAAAELAATGRVFEALSTPPADWDLLAPGLERTFSRARKSARRARHEDDDAAFHECRKRVKYLWYQLRFLEGVSPRIASLTDALKGLQKDLGDDHDLVVIRARLADEFVQVRTWIDGRASELRRRIRHRARSLFAERPGDFVGRLERDWQAWRGEGQRAL